MNRLMHGDYARRTDELASRSTAVAAVIHDLGTDMEQWAEKAYSRIRTELLQAGFNSADAEAGARELRRTMRATGLACINAAQELNGVADQIGALHDEAHVHYLRTGLS